MLRPGMPIVRPVLESRGGRITRLALIQQPAQPTVSGTGAWPMRTQVLLAYRDTPAQRIDVELRAGTTEVVAARGKPVPLFVFPNAGDYGYFLSLLDTSSVRALENGALRGVPDPLLRTMLWGALWDQVRDARLAPVRFARLVIHELPHEPDEQIVPTLTARLERALRAYVPEAEAGTLQADAEDMLWSVLNDSARSFGVRRGTLDAYIAIAATPVARDRLVGMLAADSVVGEPLRDPTRWNIVSRFLVLGDPRAAAMLAAQAAHDTSADGRRRAFTAGAARLSAQVKADYFARYFSDASLNEDWATGSLGEFNTIEHDGLTLRFLKPALDSLAFIQQNRRIFYLGSWLGAFMGGQRSAAAAAVVHDWLAAHPDLPVDLRQKVLQASDELDRTVRIRAAVVP
jgi:aminopeptidase N